MSSSTTYDPATLKIFVQTVSRAFYESSAIILLDQLLKKPAFRDDEIAATTGLTVKELGKVAGPLFGDRLIKTFTRNEHKEGPIMPHARPLSKTYYWIDHKEFCDVVRWRMDTLYKSLDKKLRTEQENKGYICSNPTCRRTYLPVDIPINFSPEGNLLCDNCGWELEDNDEQEDVKGSEDKMAMFNSQTAWIQEGLRKTSEMIFPVFDIQEWLAANTRGGIDAEVVSATSVQVELQFDGDDAKKASERAKVAAQQRTQNVIPSWHLFSTVSGQRTALGITHAAQESSKAGMSYSNDDDEVQAVDEKGVEALNDYYTNLRSQGSASGAGPSSSSFLVKPEPTSDDEDAFNSNGKRSRNQSSSPPPPAPNPYSSREPSYAASPDTGLEPKRARTSGSPAEEATGGEEGGGGGEERRMVSVDGAQMAFEDVTEEDQERMTPDEYTAYFEVWSEINS